MNEQEYPKHVPSLNGCHGIKLEFFYNAIENTQKIIQSIDIKLHILLVFMGAKIAVIAEFGYEISAFFVFAFCLLWAVSFVCIISGIITVSNPDNQVKGDVIQAKGFFYGAYLFNKDSKISLDRTYFDAPQDEEQIIRELVYEHAKLIYIRELKTKRQKYSMYLFVASVLFFVLLLFGDKIHRLWDVISTL